MTDDREETRGKMGDHDDQNERPHVHGDSCRNLAARLSEYLDGELPPDLVREVDVHFQACQRCEEFLESLDRVRRLGAAVPAPAPSPSRRGELIEQLRTRIANGPADSPAPDPEES